MQLMCDCSRAVSSERALEACKNWKTKTARPKRGVAAARLIDHMIERCVERPTLARGAFSLRRSYAASFRGFVRSDERASRRWVFYASIATAVDVRAQNTGYSYPPVFQVQPKPLTTCKE